MINYDELEKRVKYLVINKDNKNLWDYKSCFFFRTDESLYPLELDSSNISIVIDTFIEEHSRFFNRLLETYVSYCYTESEVRSDIVYAIYNFLMERKCNIFLEHYKSICFVTVKRYLKERYREIHGDVVLVSDESGEEEVSDISERVYNLTDKELYESRFIEFEDDREDLLDKILRRSPQMGQYRYVLEDLLNDNSKLNFCIKYSYGDSQLTKSHLCKVYPHLNYYAADVVYRLLVRAVERALPIKVSSRVRNQYKTVQDLVFSPGSDRDVIFLNGKRFHKSITHLDSLETTTQIRKKTKDILLDFVARGELHIEFTYKMSKIELGVIARVLHNLYFNLYLPLGIYFTLIDEYRFRVEKVNIFDNSFNNNEFLKYYGYRFIR